MTITLLMPDGVEINATQERQAKAPLYGGGAGRPLGGRSGFRVDTASNILTATSTTWTLKPCSAMIDPGASTHQGMYGWVSSADETGPVAPADATYARKDIVYVQVNDSSAGDGTAGTPSAPVLYLAGTATQTPTAPDVPPRSFLVGTIDVPKAGAGSPTVTLNPARFVAAGAPQPATLAERNALAAYDGLSVRRTDVAGRPVETFDGAAWLPTPVLTGAYSPQTISAFATSGDVSVEQVGARKRVTVAVRVLRNSGTSLSVGTTFIPLGTVLPTQARGGSTGNELYFPVSIVAGGANIIAQASVHPVTGIFYIQGTSAFTWPDAGLTTFNCTYYV